MHVMIAESLILPHQLQFTAVISPTHLHLRGEVELTSKQSTCGTYRRCTNTNSPQEYLSLLAKPHIMAKCCSQALNHIIRFLFPAAVFQGQEWNSAFRSPWISICTSTISWKKKIECYESERDKRSTTEELMEEMWWMNLTWVCSGGT